MNGMALLLAVLVACTVTGPVHGQGWSPALGDAPLSHFSDEDIALFETARIDALENQPDGETLNWANPDTGASGALTPLNTQQRAGPTCRLLRIVNRAGGQTGDSRFWFCRLPDGTWKTVPTPGANEP